MEKLEFAKWAIAYKTYYQRDDTLSTDAARDLWYEALKDIDYKILTLALNKWVLTNKWPPTIAEMRQQAAEICAGETPDWGEGWQQVQKAIRYYGQYREQEALATMDEITQQVVKRLGFRELCLSENTTADRANFRDIFAEVAARKQKNDLLSIELKKDIEKQRQLLQAKDVVLIGGKQ